MACDVLYFRRSNNQDLSVSLLYFPFPAFCFLFTNGSTSFIADYDILYRFSPFLYFVQHE